MSRRGQSCAIALAAVVLAGLVATCDEGGDLVDPSAPASITVTPETVLLEALGDTAQLVARVLDQNGSVVSGAVVSWSSENVSVATVSGTGMVTAVGNGAAVVTARVGGVTGQAQVTVGQRITSVAVGPDTVNFDALGDTVSLVAEARDANGVVVSGTPVSWSSGDESVATASGSGLVTAVGNGTAVVTASARGVTGEAQVAVRQRIASVVVTPDSLTLFALGDTVRLVAQARDSNGAMVAGASVSWSSGDQSVATVSATGLVTAVGNGAAVVTASAGGVTGAAHVAVGGRVASVVVTPDPLRFHALGDTVRLAARVLDSNGAVIAGAVVSWSSRDQSVAAVSARGLVTAVGNGAAVVTASAGGVTGEAQVAVGQRVASVVVTPDPLAFFALGDTARLAAEALDSNGWVVPGVVVSWSSGNETVATVSDAGLVMAAANGTTTVTASAGSVSGQAHVAIEQRAASVVVTDSLTLFALGDTASLAAEALDSNGAVVIGASVSWSSDDEAVATVSDAGLVTAVGRGATAVTASAGGVTAQSQVVVEQRIASVVMTPDSITLSALGDTARLVAEARDANGAVIPGVAVSWLSGNDSVATVSDNGLVTAAANGVTVATASAGGVTGQAHVAVEQRAASVVVTPRSLQFLALGGAARLAAEALDSNGAVVVGAAVTWLSDDEAVATVSDAGLVTAVGRGTTAVTASAGGIAAQAEVVVEQRVDSVVVTPDSITLSALGDTARLVAEARDANGAVIPGVAVSWLSGNDSVAAVSANGLVIAAANGITAVSASAGGVTSQVHVKVEQRVASVGVTPDSLGFAALGDTTSLAAEAHDANGAIVAGATVSWSSGNDLVATVSDAGLVTSVANGATAVTAIAGGVTAQAQVVVEQRIASVVVTPDSITLAALGDTAWLAAEARDANGAIVAGATVSWSSDDDLVATVSDAGLVTSVANGATAVTASAGGVTAQAQVVVEQRIASVVVTPDSITLAALGDTARLVAEPRDSNGAVVSGVVVSWSSGNDTVATVSDAGLVTAAANGTTAVAASAGGVTGEARVAVEQRVASVVVTPDSLGFAALGDTASLTVEARDANGTIVSGAVASWSSDDEVVATVSVTGLVTAAGNGATVVTASVDGVTGQASVAVEQRIDSVVVTPDLLGFNALGDTARLVAEARDSNGAPVTGAAVSWSSGNDSVATVSDNGLVTAAANGSTAVTATAGGVAGQAQVTVGQQIASVVVTPNSLNFTALGDTASLAAEARDSNGAVIAGAAVTWSSANDAVGTVSDVGLVTAAGNGSTSILASSGGVSGEAQVVVEQRVDSVAVTPDSLGFTALGDTARLTVEARDANGAVVAGAVVAWSSENGTVATVSNAGLVTSVANGTTVVTANVDGATAQAQVTVEQRVDSVAVTPDSLGFAALGDTARLIAEARDSNGAPVSGAAASWSSGNDSVATVNDNGLVTAVEAGTTAVTASVQGRQGSASVTVRDSDKDALIALYSATNGILWSDNKNWLSDAPLDEWEGVSTNAEGRVSSLDLRANGLTGALPPELGDLTSLVDRLYLQENDLTGPIPPELGNLSSLEQLSLRDNSLTGPIPPELGGLSSLEQLWLYGNDLTGSIPPELGGLSSLERLYLYDNDLTGSIPPELGGLSSLERLYLYDNDLTGQIPPELGNLSSLERLWLDGNDLTGPIPPELGDLSSLERLYITNNDLTGPIPSELGDLSRLEQLYVDSNTVTGQIPPELGRLSSLEYLYLNVNDLTGPIPPELGSLAILKRLILFENDLTGSIPSELGNLSDLERLWLDFNDLTGTIPPELGSLSSLEHLLLNNNDLTGSIPPELGSLSGLEYLWLESNSMSGTMPDEMRSLTDLIEILVDKSVCAPKTTVFENWLNDINFHNVAYCYVVPPLDSTVAYVMQVVPPRNYSVPLVAEQPALLRVFVTANNPDSVGMPPVRTTFYSGGVAVHTANIPAQPSTPIPNSVDEGDFSRSANAEIPGSVLSPGLEMVVEIDPDSTLGSSVDVVRRIPATGRTSLDVRAVDSFELTVIPLLWTSDPDSTLLELTSALDSDHELFQETRTLLPINEMEVTVHDPVWTTSDSACDMLSLVEAVRVAEAGTGYWKGMIRRTAGVFSGCAYVGGQESFSEPEASTIAHELGHNLSLWHAPCGGAADPDRSYPYSNGDIGVWGWTPGTTSLVFPSIPDLMTYCGPPEWISDYHYYNAFNHRDTTSVPISSSSPVLLANQQTLLLWGGADADGNALLNPAFVIDAPPSLPNAGGAYRITGEAENGSMLFSFAFEMQEIADGDGGSGFAFALPVEPSWAGTLNRITLTGGGRSAVLDREGDEAAVLLRDPATGQVRGLLLDLPANAEAQADWLTPLSAQNMDVQISRGIPPAGAWQR